MFETGGLNHVTIFVRDLKRSLEFYTEILRMKIIHEGDDYAYLESGTTWFCISQKPFEKGKYEQIGVNHISLTVASEDFDKAVAHLRENHVPIVRDPVIRGKGKTVNFLDPDGLQWEFHTSNLAERMTVIDEMERKKRA
ncbi:glutathione transferase FosA [Collibacillus ludicampi]|jgi:catechol 2,3-dioxygenase-like lactoylglutathione lyase family enzyme|uniref:Glutathione transferase FosA n=1 Tax=Collibacillus ludicampi TaxID=2771369 RepID=A0AAV4LJT8_9BACL|nr:VOC family protein [Collibacillus ludicampi]GIM48034.1 glutathione transferase FosA [Collibacillus ludicampi]